MDQKTVDILFTIKGKLEEARARAKDLPDENRLVTVKAWLEGLMMLLDGQIHAADQQVRFQWDVDAR